MTSRTELFLQAKQIIRAHPDYDDARIAEECRVHPLDSGALDVIAQARKDVDAGDTRSPHLPS